jgi:hypothetical protein
VGETDKISLKFDIGAAQLIFTIALLFHFHLQYSPRLHAELSLVDHGEKERVSFMH